MQLHGPIFALAVASRKKMYIIQCKHLSSSKIVLGIRGIGATRGAYPSSWLGGGQ